MTFKPTVRIAYPALRDIYRQVACALGADDEEARIYAECFSRADLRHDTQGLPLWLEWALPLAEAGGAQFGRPLKIVRESPSGVVIDGAEGFGQIIAARTMDLVIEKAKKQGVAIGLVSSTTDMAMVGNYAMQALEHGCIGVAACTAGPATVAPWGGRDPVFGTDPLAVAIPAGDGPPIVIDMCCAAYSIGTLVQAARLGRVDDRHVVTDRDGVYLNTPAAIVSDLTMREPPLTGAILPEGVRGMSLLLLVEVLAGLLSGNGASLDQIDWSNSAPPRVGAFFCAIDISKFASLDNFEAKLRGFAEAVRAIAPAVGFEEVRLPGDRAAALADAREKAGILVSEKHWALLQSLFRRYEIPVPAFSPVA